MATQRHQRMGRVAPERYRRSQLEGRRGTRVAGDQPRPLEFDERGFPIRQRIPSFVQRVARLLGEERAR
jgi:hypothetical protein